MQKTRSFPLILRLGLIVGVLLATLSVGTTLLIRSSKAAFAIASSPVVHTPVTGYWTKERMQNTHAMSIPRVSTSSPTRPDTTTLAYSTDTTATLATPVDLSNYTTPPAAYVGKIFYHNPITNKDYACSGTAIVSNNNSIVDTAAHCVYFSGAWSTDVMFCPQYYNGNTPEGCWSEWQVWAPQTWLNNQNDDTHDFGMIVVQPMGQTTLAASIGAAGYDPNNQTPTATAYGYPGFAPFNGEQMYSVSGNITTTLGGTIMWMSNNNMTEGASGGPWFVTYNGSIYLIGHNSTSDGSNSTSPYFGNEWIALLNDAQNAPNSLPN
jgi:hypothetical protein